jgi:hypothetical protein
VPLSSRSTIPAKWKNNIKVKIEFVSISVDNIKDREKWSNLVNKKQLGGIQLLADKEFNSEFIKQYI